MHYTAIIHEEDGATLAEFPDCPGCQTFARGDQEIAARAQESLEGWLEAHLTRFSSPPKPFWTQYGNTTRVLNVSVRPRLAVALQVRWMREERGLSQEALGELLRVSQQQIGKLESPDCNPTVVTLDRLRDLGVDVAQAFAVPGPVEQSARLQSENTIPHRRVADRAAYAAYEFSASMGQSLNLAESAERDPLKDLAQWVVNAVAVSANGREIPPNMLSELKVLSEEIVESGNYGTVPMPGVFVVQRSVKSPHGRSPGRRSK